jgi:23S rRNA (cytosine1962-C5)-methyltransferase
MFIEQAFYRLVYGEGDGLPELVVDRFGEVMTAQISAAGMEMMEDEIVAALGKIFKPHTILLRNDNSLRALDGLHECVEIPLGEVSDNVRLTEHGVQFDMLLRSGQKTGWYFDQHDNRVRLCSLVKANGCGACLAISVPGELRRR